MILKKVLLWFIKFYRSFISPLFPPSCRFQPTCSQYALDAIDRFGAIKGGFLAIKRILRCHPFCKGGYDPVPQSLSDGESLSDAIVKRARGKGQRAKDKNKNKNIDT